MEALLATSGWKAIHSGKGEYNLLSKQVALYELIIKSEAWSDYQSRLVQLREGTKKALERGVVDRFGKTHEEEQRALLFLLDQLISYVPSLQEAQKALGERLQAEENLAGRPLYGDDILGALTEDL